MNEDDYGINLSLDISEFQSEIKEAINIAKEATEEIKAETRKVKIFRGEEETELFIEEKKAVDDLKDSFENLASAKDRIKSGDIKITGVGYDYEEMEESAKKFEEWQEKENQKPMSPLWDFSEISDAVEGKTEELSENFEDVAESEEGFFDASTKLNMKLATLGLGILGVKKTTELIKNPFKKIETLIGNAIPKATMTGVKSLKRFALSLFGIQSGFMAVRKAINSYMSMDSDLQKSIQQTWQGLGSFFAPMLEYVTNLFRKLLAYVNAVVTALTGINFVARANAKALDKQAKAGAKASKSLASFDEIQNLDNGGGGEANTIDLPEVDSTRLNEILAIIEKIKEIALQMFEPIQQSWAIYGQPLIESIKGAFFSIIDLGKAVGGSIFEVWTNGTGKEIMDLIFQKFILIFDIVKGLADAFTNAWVEAGNGTGIIQNLADHFKVILDFGNQILDTIKKWVLSPEFQKALNIVFGIIRDITGAMKDVAQWVLNMWNEYVKPVLDEKVMPLLGDLAELISAIWEFAIKPLADYVKTVLGPIFEAVIKGITGEFSHLLDFLRGIIQFLTGMFTGDWVKTFDALKLIFTSMVDTMKDKYVNGFNFMLSILKGIVNSMIYVFESFVNYCIRGINSLIKPLTKVGNSILSALGIKGFSFSTIGSISLPRLAIGTDLVNSDGLAYLHKGEKVVPADVVKGGYSGSDNSETNDLLRQLLVTLEEKDFSASIGVDDIGKASVKYINSQSRIRGGSII